MKIIIDDKIPYIQGALESVAECIYLPGKDTTREVVADADALITRTRTRCHRDILEGSHVKFIATATIGFDHIDRDFCEEAGIGWTNAPGCNAKSVEQYVGAALAHLRIHHGFQLAGKTLGVVGVGNVGKLIAKLGHALGMKVLLNDPPRARAEGSANFVSLDTIQKECDVISLHTPLNMDGDDKTYHLADDSFFSQLEKNPVILNSCRGEVIETQALKSAISAGKISHAVIDCWENEPAIDLELLDSVTIATPHIAGYSRDGKATGTAMSVRAISRHFGLGLDDWECSNVEPAKTQSINIPDAVEDTEVAVCDALLQTYPIIEDDARLRANTTEFEKQRGDYPVRREFSYYSVAGQREAVDILAQIGFRKS
ncbi:4-phosphoerythronate dehydrogenase PdxB [Persicirhabdus sediminis]|uniref:4-phosphoerythronate dehydrogenase PdxB n=1 Tax=Persicirhabdus sediminis TaxID=454144 RepID=A0A8J7MF49_9BACT|nr:4-phosphoerythronate dehydrogenase PdxB [Persicirhabdus sediminis]MBK1791587.1 4-phosphoerythronate dehydrogenase PdxB [Persicirhabdus sediminis]